MSTDSFILREVETALRHLLTDQRHRWQAVNTQLSTVFDELEVLVLSGGKRLRPQFLHWGWVAAGGDPTEVGHHSFGAAIELLHAFALFHDDVIDDAHTRRGHETTHRRLARHHEEDALAGESRRFGEGSAVLIGDIAYSLADFLMKELPNEARPYWNELRLEMNVGQYLDTLGSALRERSLEHAHSVSRLKTAKYTVERPLHIGAMAAHAENAQALLHTLSAYGIPLGTAFQLRDDVLGAFGNESVTGKSVGGDFHEAKPTALLAFAYQNANPQELQVLQQVGERELSSEDIEAIQNVILDTKALEKTEALIVSLRDQAVASITEIKSEARTELERLAVAVTDRSV